MDTITSFNNKDKKFEFTKLPGDASKKEFYKIKNNDNLILIKISKEIGIFDEKFDQDLSEYSQYDYFKFSFQFLYEKIGQVPKIITYDDNNGIIIMENIGDLRLKEYYENNINTNYIYQSIEWLIKLQKINNNNINIINLRTYGIYAMRKEIDVFDKYVLKYISSEDQFIFQKNINNFLNLINNSSKTIVHRDYQLRNIMIKNDNINIIDTQDICIGPYFCDICSFLFNSNILFSIDDKIKYAKYFYENNKNEDDYSFFMKKVWIYGLIRILKNYGSHQKYYVEDNRLASLENLQGNKILLEQIRNKIDNTFIYDILDKSKITPIILAAGKGTRMRGNSNIPKPLFEINGRPMIFYILDVVTKINPYKIIIVIGYEDKQIINKLKEYPYQDFIFVEQLEQLGTGHAVMQTENILNNFLGQSLILFGDKPTITVDVLEKILFDFYQKKLDASFVSYYDIESHNKTGRVIRNENNQIVQIFEDPDEKFPSKEFVGGIQLYNNQKMLKYIKKINNNNNKKEYYLADIIKLMHKDGHLIGNIIINNRDDILNVNTPDDLKMAEQIINNRLNFCVLTNID